MKVTQDDIDTLARTIYGEARGEDIEGKFLVAEVILNRWSTEYRGMKTITAVCHDPWQFSCWNKSDPNREKLLAVTVDTKVFRECMAAGLLAMDAKPRLPKLTRHYCTGAVNPNWAEGKEPCLVNGRHRFYEAIA